MQKLLDKHRSQGKRPVVFVNTSMLRHMSSQSRKELFKKINETGLRVYKCSSAYQLTRYSKVCVVRYGHLNDYIARKIVSSGGVILSGDL